MSNVSSQLKKGFLELCVLTLLTKEDQYGYNLVHKITEFVDISEGTVYPLLKRIKDNGFVNTYITESSDGAARKYYQITEAGRIELDHLISEWEEFKKSIDNILKVNK